MKSRCIHKSWIKSGIIFLGLLAMFWVNAVRTDAASYNNAVTLPTNGNWSGSYWHTSADREHWYKVILPADGKLTYKAMSYACLSGKLYTQDLQLINDIWVGNASETSPRTVEKQCVLSKGTYYFKVSESNGHPGRYKLNVLFSKYTTNDGNAVSYDFPQNLSATPLVNGALTETDMEDWYRIYISGAKNCKIHLTSYFSFCNFTLYNSDLSKTLLSGGLGGSETSPQSKIYDVEVSGGTYYLKVYRSQYHEAGKYMLNLMEAISVNSITLNKTTLTMDRDNGERLTANVWPLDATNKAVTWKSSNPSVAPVSNSGFVTAKSAGTATITVTAADGGAKASCMVTVLERPEVLCQRYGHTGTWITSRQPTVFEKGIQYRTCTRCYRKESTEIAKLTPTARVTASQITLKVKQATTKVKISGLAQGDYIKSWKSSNTGIVKVTKNGKITAQKKTGTATVTVTLASGKKVQIRVKVQKGTVAASKISGIKKALTIKRGASQTLKPVISPITCSQKVTYKTSNKKVATVSSAGKIKAKKKGTAVITVTCGKKKVKCKITVR